MPGSCRGCGSHARSGLTDEYGTEIAVRGRSNFTVFPTNFIAKRYEGRETNFIASAYQEMIRTAESLG